MAKKQTAITEPDRSCPLCPRLVDYRKHNHIAEPTWFNGPVPPFGDPNPRLLIVGLAPGVSGANRTGRPFTGDYAGDLLYATLAKFKFSSGTYKATPDDGLKLKDCMISNSVRCVPPANKPTSIEINTCRQFLAAQIESLECVDAIVALGRIAHDQVLTIFGAKKSAHTFAHGAKHPLNDTIILFDSYHCSRYNTNTGRLTPAMFESVFREVRKYLDKKK